MLKRIQAYIQTNRASFHRTHQFLHMLYFTFVAVGGPYDLAAAGLLLFGLVAWAFHLGD